MIKKCLTCGGTGVVINDDAYDGEFMLKSCPDCVKARKRAATLGAAIPNEPPLWELTKPDDGKMELRA